MPGRMAAIVASPLASMEPMNAGHGPATIVRTRVLAKTTVAATARVMLRTSPMAGAMRPPIIPAAVGMAAIAANRRVLMEPTRVALWDTHATIHMPVKTVPAVALNALGINLTRGKQNTYKSSSKYS